MPHPFVRFLGYTLLAGTTLGALPACNQYAFTLNTRELYSPPPLFSDYDLEDSALKACVQQTIADQNVREADQLGLLICSHAGVQSLVGLETFEGVEQMNLSNNRLTQVDELLLLPRLQIVQIDGNPDLQCGTLDSLAAQGVTIASAPQHCHRHSD